MSRKSRSITNPQNLTWPQVLGYLVAITVIGVVIAFIITDFLPYLVSKL